MITDLHKIATDSKASQGVEELEWLLGFVAKIKPKIILEIGVHQGFSLETWYAAFKPELLIGIDNDLHALKYKANCEIIEADSHDPDTFYKVFSLLNGRKVDFLFIDGDHSYAGVKDDFEMYSGFVGAGGIIAFDDMNLFDNPSVEVYKYWEEIKDNYRSQSFHADSNGIGVLYV